MAHGFVSYSKQEPGFNLGAMVAGKIKSSYGMAAEERKQREAEIEQLKKKESEGKATAQDINRLNDLEAKDTERKKGVKNSFFAKALASEFGGDRKRRLQGTFSKDPRASQDPSLTKEQRFSALLDEGARPGEEPLAPEAPVDDINPMDYGDANAQASTPQQSTLQKLLGQVSNSFDTISNKLTALKAEEKKSVNKSQETSARIGKFTGVFEAIKNYFDKDNDLKKVENDIEQKKIENFREQQEDAQSQSELDAIKATEDLSKQEDIIDRPENEGSGLLGKIFEGIKGIGKFLMGGGKKGGGIKGQSKAYSSPIGPQPMNSKSPWAALTGGNRGGMFGQGKFAPRLPATKLSEGGVVPKKKLAEGGIYDNPTTTKLNPGDAVIPLNRNNPIADSFKASGQEADPSPDNKDVSGPMAEILQLPTKVAGGLVLTKMSEAFSGVAGVVKPIVAPIMNAIAPAFGLPGTIIAGIFGGGPAQAATGGFNFDAFRGKRASRTKKRSSSSPSSTPPTTGGANLGATMRAGETIQAQGLNDPGGFIQGGSGKGGENYDDGGYAVHYHLTPPTNDPAGWAQSRGVALTAAQMMLNRGSKVYFGNIKEWAQPATLADQIAREQQAHTQPNRTQGGIDMQEQTQDGNMRLKFPLKVTNVGGSKQGASGRTARIMGTNVTLAHGAPGSANSIETATNPTAVAQQPVALGSDPASSQSSQPASTPLTAGATSQHQGPIIVPIPAVAAAQQAIQEDAPIDTSSPFSIYNQTPSWGSMYGSLMY